MVKHTIKLKDYTPFKERYHRIPPHQFEEVRKYLQEMLEIGAIKCSNSPPDKCDSPSLTERLKSQILYWT